MPPSTPPLLEPFVRFRASWPPRGWSFDNRIDCVASSFHADFATEARALLLPLLPHAFTERTLKSAPRAVIDIATRTDGIRAAQMILSADPIGRVTPFGLWWPWEEGRTISIRLGLDGASPAEVAALSEVFGAR